LKPSPSHRAAQAQLEIQSGFNQSLIFLNGDTMNAEAYDTTGQAIRLKDVTLRDGEQQDKKHAVMDVQDRIRVFDELIDAGINTIEIGHLGNQHDIDFTQKLVEHIEEKGRDGDFRYDEVGLQVLFGSQTDLIEKGVAALDGFDSERVTVHVYDRASPNLRGLASEPYSIRESAQRVIEAAAVALDKGYKNISISGEGTVDPDLSIDDAAEKFYLPIIDQLKLLGAENINVNLPNTFGSSLEGEWNEVGLGEFDRRIKNIYPDVTTSIHVHDDFNSATEYALAAIKAGFDTVEGTMIGMGERSGNVALVDVMARLLESARSVAEAEDKSARFGFIGRSALASTIWHSRHIEDSVATGLNNWFKASQAIADIYGTQNRFHQTSLGNQEAYGAGSGPHAHANQEMLRDPVNKPLWRNYGRVALVHAMLGRPEARQIIEVDPERIRQITLATHAAGGSTERVLSDTIPECIPGERAKAIQLADNLMLKVLAVAVAASRKQPTKPAFTLV
jgi:hypothetical protein